MQPDALRSEILSLLAESAPLDEWEIGDRLLGEDAGDESWCALEAALASLRLDRRIKDGPDGHTNLSPRRLPR